MDYPEKFAIETVLGCNLRCVECAVGSELVQRKHGVMSYERYLAVMEKISAHASYIYLHLWGEPMLNPDIYAMIAHASRTCRTNISGRCGGEEAYHLRRVGNHRFHRRYDAGRV